jgi:hypothetical protein
MNAREAAQTFVTVAAVHVPINFVGWAIGTRTAPLLDTRTTRHRQMGSRTFDPARAAARVVPAIRWLH